MDFHKGVPLDKDVIEANAIDDHHIFPRKHLREQGLSEMIDSVLNHTLIDKKTNIRIGGRAPSKYLAEMKAELSDSLLGTILESHNLPADDEEPLFLDNYEAFLVWRLRRLTELLSEVVGREFPISPDEVEGPETSEAPLEVVDEDEAAELLSQAGLDDEEVETVGAQLPILAREVLELLRSRSRTQEEAEALEDFLRQIVSWEGTVAELGRSVKSSDGLTGYVMVRRIPRLKGVFIYVSPSGMKATLRLKNEDVNPSDLNFAEKRNVKTSNRYQIRIDLESEESRAEAVHLARLAYEKAG